MMEDGGYSGIIKVVGIFIHDCSVFFNNVNLVLSSKSFIF